MPGPGGRQRRHGNRAGCGPGKQCGPRIHAQVSGHLAGTIRCVTCRPATRCPGHIRVAGAISTAVYAHTKGWPTVIPVEAWVGGLAAALLIGALAGLLPAIRAARLSPTQALWSL